ncbi:hypothetical protein ACOT81_00940 [Streptomyces sp. WI04-05B]|uniref:hypothetical protein n=1 Tax=Streptomyces TaxID=1883 RepID=UPI0029A2BBDF|nr:MULTISPECIES: hypothetical protein [unclassified Streptomyces]MDX2541478.1 hypothetical protein [Streptomyces sp. WI04-05B]MDX2583788.1 hypothetical protein [Streptomyces sp. WI04-05A]
MQQYDLTDAQRKAFEENEADFRRFDDQIRGVQETARARLTNSGWAVGQNDGFPCLSCWCPDFQAGGPQGSCKRVSCRHALINHDMPT